MNKSPRVLAVGILFGGVLLSFLIAIALSVIIETQYKSDCYYKVKVSGEEIHAKRVFTSIHEKYLDVDGVRFPTEKVEYYREVCEQ